ncbi:hypothetical protein SDRG_06968 [Saprolegnia diclina VS20]|uniref:Uncharacterized protein n=1 Tax=Saprolegnia diclina (strain VS20) TaxID=1156394 RepID=T0RZA1_SAPDV|nr:hypothetical protein SDRG_06968 [Saprolegnia diclina VS20]EQC35687.1 hypothetical protein SDRG_06968 [Saprolegnia diclina VS20]|eukprot:XP_008611004.1 hypothetical protein SDRG_06968 [Saprolegnia diclina VS20]
MLAPRDEFQADAVAARVIDLDNKLCVHMIEVDIASPRHDDALKCSEYMYLVSSPQGGDGDTARNPSPHLKSFRLEKFAVEARHPRLDSLVADYWYMRQLDAAYNAVKMRLGHEPIDWVHTNETAWMAATPTYGYSDLLLHST